MRRLVAREARPLVAPPDLGLMEGYAAYERTGVAERHQSGTPAPYGYSLGHIAANSVWSETAHALGLSPVGLFTVWAKRSGDMSWQPLAHAPNSDTALYATDNASVLAAQRMAFGNPLPFIAMLTPTPLTTVAIDAMWSETAYEPYETEAVYRQDDAKSVPTIYFLHWAMRLESSDVPSRVRSIDSAAAMGGGQLVFAAQVPKTRDDRAFPVTPFDAALATQLGLAAVAREQRQAPGLGLLAEPPPVQPVASPKPLLPPWLAATAVGAGVAVLGFWFARRS